MTRGKIVLLPFPFDDFSASKVRPAVCMTEPIGPHHHIVVAFITSKIPATQLETDLVLDTQSKSFASPGLRQSSTLRLHRLLTVTTNIIQRELGELPSDLRGEVNNRLRKLFALT